MIKAIIFDLDGVLLPTNVFHREATVAAIKAITGINTAGHPLVSEHSMMSTKLKISAVQQLYKFDKALNDSILNLKDKVFFELLEDIAPNKNVIECLREINTRGIKTAIASNSRFNNLNRVLEITHLRNYFDVIVSAEEVSKPKPAPDILYEAYFRLKLHINEYADTVFVEDTDEGAAAGHASPSSVVRVNSPDDLNIDLFKEWL